MADTPVRTAETEIVVDETTGETVRETEHFRQGDRHYRIVHERTTVQTEDATQTSPRRWTRLSLKSALAQAEMLAAARAYLSAEEIATGYTAWEALTDCDYIEEGYPTAERWNAILDGAAQALGKTRAEIEQFLAQIPQDGAL